MWELPPLSCETQETFQRQRAGTSVGEKRAAVTACDSQRLSRELAATAVPDTPPGGDAGAIWRGGGGDDEEQTCSSRLLSKRNGCPQISDAEGEGERSSSNAAFCFVFISLKRWRTAERNMNCCR